MSDFEAMHERCGDPSVPVVCFPRNVDSVAFYVGRSDFRTFRSKELDELVRELDRHSRTVILFGHRNSPETLAPHLPPHLRMVDRRPMGLCESHYRTALNLPLARRANHITSRPSQCIEVDAGELEYCDHDKRCNSKPDRAGGDARQHGHAACGFLVVLRGEVPHHFGTLPRSRN